MKKRLFSCFVLMCFLFSISSSAYAGFWDRFKGKSNKSQTQQSSTQAPASTSAKCQEETSQSRRILPNISPQSPQPPQAGNVNGTGAVQGLPSDRVISISIRDVE